MTTAPIVRPEPPSPMITNSRCLRRFAAMLLTLGAGTLLLHGQATVTSLGIGTAALLGGDLTDPENDGLDFTGAENNLAGNGWNFLSATANEKSYFEGAEGAFNVFDNRLGPGSDKWCCNAREIVVEFGQPISLTHFTVSSANDTPTRDWNQWTVAGSNDGTTFTDIYVDDGSVNHWTSRLEVVRFDLDTPSPEYTHFRFRATSNRGDTLWQIGEIELFGRSDSTDTDGDTLPDWWEIANLPAGAELDNGTTNPDFGPAGDPDNDMSDNAQEFARGTNPSDEDTDGDTLKDGVEDGGGIYVSATQTGTDPLKQDTDGDTLGDGVENPNLPFVDASQPGTDPNKANTDGDAYNDGDEIIRGTDPTVFNPPPREYVNNFDGYPDGTKDLGDDTVIAGSSASIQAGTLELTRDGVAGGFSSFSIPPLANSSKGWTASFDLIISDGVGLGEPADGMSFNYGNAAMGELGSAEEGMAGVGLVTENLSFEIDTWMNVDAEQGVNIAEKVGGIDTDLAFTNGRILADGTEVGGRVTISWNPVDGASFTTEGLITNADFVNVATNFEPRNDHTFIISARVGGSTQTLRIDNLIVTTGTIGQEDTLQTAIRQVNGELEISWNSAAGHLYDIVSALPGGIETTLPADWVAWNGNEMIAATPPRNTLTMPLPADPARFFAVRQYPAPPVLVFADDFEGGQGDWTTGSDNVDGSDWELGAPDPLQLGGPPAAASGANVFGTDLDADYLALTSAWVRSPSIDLAGFAGATLTYSSWVDIEPEFDSGEVRVLNAGDNSLIAVLKGTIDGTSTAWREQSLTLPASALDKAVKFEWRLTTDAIGNRAGFYIDDISVQGVAP